MAYDIKKTLIKGGLAFLAGGITALIPVVQGITDPILIPYIGVAVAVLTMGQNFP